MHRSGRATRTHESSFTVRIDLGRKTSVTEFGYRGIASRTLRII